jgi:hypothetical protein
VASREAVLNWLAGRRPTPPPILRRHLTDLVVDSSETLPDHLADAGVALLGRVLSHPEGGRELALDLLAADALVTYAFEAQAEFDIGGLTGLARRIAEATA